MTGVNETRAAFLNFFARNGHKIVASGSLIPANDPTLMFTNAGMVPFKNVFTGAESRKYNRAVSSQKCVRAGGKHNDLDNVGYTARHHTFFEMLGNFSFGDYFKETAIELAWELVTKEYALDPKRLLVTVYANDDEAFNIWKKISGFADKKIIRIATSDNFWSMGTTGPCGPCSEIFYDHGEHIPGGPPGSKDEDGDRFVEIWNLVFMQYDKQADGDMPSLPKPSIDTGMGLERISAVLQGTHDNYEIDLMQTLIEASIEATGNPNVGADDTSHRVIADHLRAVCFLIADGVLPSNEGRGYVLRRIMRRAMRHAHMLGAKDPMIYRLVPALIGEMGQAYEELRRAEVLISETIKQEETRFGKTLDRGLGILATETANMAPGDILSGDVAFRLYDTYGFPLDMTADALKAREITIDCDGFSKAMERQKAEARKAWAGSGDMATEKVWFELHEQTGASEFLGYTSEQAEAKILALVKNGKQVKQLRKGDEGFIITNQTPFYGEAGGQAGDKGTISNALASFDVKDTAKKLGNLFVHHGHVKKSAFKPGDMVELSINSNDRRNVCANHSATHILHAALRKVLGKHVTQKGSLVNADRLRFDFSHPKPVSKDELQHIEAITNAIIRQNSEVTTRMMEQKAAIKAGAMALFGEKYDDEVRVVSMGEDDFSVELCGGTHVRHTGDIGLLHITAESAVAAGVRRIEAVTGSGATQYLAEQIDCLQTAASLLKTSTTEIPERIAALLKEKKSLERELAHSRKQQAFGDQSKEDVDVPLIGDIKFLARTVENIAGKDLRSLVDTGKKQLGSAGVVVIVAKNEGKASLLVGVTDDITDTYNAVELVRTGASALGGKGGGGRPDMAQAGGPNGNKAEQAIKAIREVIAAIG
jgi:alanyl-tRNA synthetase